MPSPKAALAVAAIILEKKSRGESLQLWDIANLIKNIQTSIDLGSLRIYKSGAHYYSDEVADIVGDYLLLGMAKQSSPILLTEKGEKILGSMLSREADKEFVGKVKSTVEELVATH